MINHLKVKRKSIEIYKWQVLKFKIFQKVAYCMTYLTFIKKKKILIIKFGLDPNI